MKYEEAIDTLEWIRSQWNNGIESAYGYKEITFAIQALKGINEVHDKADTFNGLGDEYEKAFNQGYESCLWSIEEKIEYLE